MGSVALSHHLSTDGQPIETADAQYLAAGTLLTMSKNSLFIIFFLQTKIFANPENSTGRTRVSPLFETT